MIRPACLHHLRARAALIVVFTALWLWWPSASAIEGLHIRVGTLKSDQMTPTLRDVALDCQLRFGKDTVRCDNGQFAAAVEGIGRISTALKASVRIKDDIEAELRLRSTRFAGLHLGSALLVVDGSGWRISTTGTADLSSLPVPDKGWQPVGVVDFDIDASSTSKDWQQLPAVTAEFAFRQAGFSSASGDLAAEALAGKLDWRSSPDGQLQTALTLTQGQAYRSPVLLDFATQAANLKLSGQLHDSGRYQFDQIQLSMGSGFRAEGILSGNWRRSPVPSDAALHFDASDLSQITPVLLTPFVLGTDWETFKISGAANGTVNIQNRLLDGLALKLSGTTLSLGTDQSVRDLNADLHWQRRQGAQVSTLSWGGGQWGPLPLGAVNTRWLMAGRGAYLFPTLRVPIGDGALVVDRFSLADIGLPSANGVFRGHLEPIRIAPITTWLGLPAFGGTLAGDIPDVHYDGGYLHLDGAVTVRLFDGSIKINNLFIDSRNAGAALLGANARFRNIDLRLLTEAFAMGSMTGRVNLDVDDLLTHSLEPLRFSAHLYSSPDDDQPHTVSQQAVDMISSLGSGSSGAVSRGLLRFFKTFHYGKIDWRCEFADGICEMYGANAQRTEPWTIMSAGIPPAVRILGNNARVDGNRLLKQIMQAINNGHVEVK